MNPILFTKDYENRIITGDALEVLRRLPARTFNLVFTSPPYPGQKGDERSVPEWLDWFYQVLVQTVRVTAEDGVVGINVDIKRTEDGWRDIRLFTEVPRLMSHVGLNMIDIYSWVKPNPAPNGPLFYCDIPAWEPVFLATTAEAVPDYFYEPVRREYRPKSVDSNGRIYTSRVEGGAEPNEDGARQTNVLTISSSGSSRSDIPRAEGQSFPIDLPERFILQHTQPGDSVLDMFVGAGTTCRAAQVNGRYYTGIEIREDEASKAREWLRRPYQRQIIGTERL